MDTETPWIDAWIRWDRNSKDIIDHDDDGGDCDCEEEERVPPTKEFSFAYELPGSNHSLSLTIKGFPSESEQIWNSTGLTLWPSSHYLCEYLLENYENLLRRIQLDNDNNNRTIRAVELGSGLGRCGLLMHHLAKRLKIDKSNNAISSHVYMTDGDTDTLAQLRDNVHDNTTTSDDGSNDSSNHGVSCHQLLWGTEFAQRFCEQNLRNNSADLVFGSDLVYAPKVIKPLFETVTILMLNTKTKFLMAHSDRREGSSVTLQMVLEGAQDAGLQHEILQTIEKDGIYIIAFFRCAQH